MGEHQVESQRDSRGRRTFMKALLADVQALEQMLKDGMVESGVRRIGAEQEMFLVNRTDMSPAMRSTEVLAHIQDPRLTTELARFNLEANLSPRLFGGTCLRDMEAEIEEALSIAREAAQREGSEILLTGILPTLKQSHLTLDSMTPIPRYRALNDAICTARGGGVHIHIKGGDDLQIQHDNVMLEAANTSFQIHFQVGPEEFAKLYNLAQLVSAPVMAAAVNSPLLFGHRLWSETRVALFQSSVDARSQALQRRSHPPRVQFGERWLKGGILDLIREDIARFRVILGTNLDRDPLEVLAEGGYPRLSALRLHTGTVWRWNRACFGPGEGGNPPHLRIENRILPSGPTVIDEMANAAFFFGLMAGVGDEIPSVADVMRFQDAHDNFYAAAQHGLKAQFTWVDGARVTASDLILHTLLPMARQGLTRSAIDPHDIDRYLGVIEARVRADQTGSAWILGSLQSMGDGGRKDARLNAITAGMLTQQRTGAPAHTWPHAVLSATPDWRSNYLKVGQIMTTDLFTVGPEDVVDLAASVMEWRQVKHVPVEDADGRLLGLVSYRDVLTLVSRGIAQRSPEPVPVTQVMTQDVITVTPETPSLEAMQTMREKNIGCLPVLEGERLVGIITSRDFLTIATTLLEAQLKQL